MHSQGGETSIQDSYSRWGVKGSSEVSEGLTAVYRYEEGLDLATTTLSDNNRLSYVGLSGGFGTVTMGRIWSAAYNHVGALTDTGIHDAPNASVGTRTSNALSYSASTGPISFQIDANRANGVNKTQLGMTLDMGFGKVGAALANDKSSAVMKTDMSAVGFSIPVGSINLHASWRQNKTTEFAKFVTIPATAERCKREALAGADKPGDISYKPATGFDEKTGAGTCSSDTDIAKYTFLPGSPEMKSTTETTALKDPITAKDTAVHYGVSGSLGDTGMSYAVNFADLDNGSDLDTTPWNFNVSKSLGGGASLAFEYVDYDGGAEGMTENESVLRLKVDF